MLILVILGSTGCTLKLQGAWAACFFFPTAISATEYTMPVGMRGTLVEKHTPVTQVRSACMACKRARVL